MRFRPLGDRVVVERKIEETTKGGIFIPDTVKDKPLEGKVIAVGKEALDDGISEGDIVVFAKFSGLEITIDGTEYLILVSKEILGIMK